MVTSDVRRGEDVDIERSLKFWLWNPLRSKFAITAQVYS